MVVLEEPERVHRPGFWVSLDFLASLGRKEKSRGYKVKDACLAGTCCVRNQCPTVADGNYFLS